MLEKYYNKVLPLRPFLKLIRKKMKINQCQWDDEIVLSFEEMKQRGWTCNEINLYMQDFKFITYDDQYGMAFFDVWFDFEIVKEIEQANPDLLYRVTLTKLLAD